MGIRYYAYPIDRDLVELASRDPRAFLSDDPLMDAWGPPEERPPMLYLDKCWSRLQMLFGDGSERPRASAALVHGQVTHTGYGWIPHIQVLDPADVAEFARDIVCVDEEEVRALTDDETERDYVLRYLADAKGFVTRLAARGDGLVYLIG